VYLAEFLIVFVLAPLYFLPFIVALVRGKRNSLAILLLNLLLGWTLIGWVGALVWAVLVESPTPTESMA